MASTRAWASGPDVGTLGAAGFGAVAGGAGGGGGAAVVVVVSGGGTVVVVVSGGSVVVVVGGSVSGVISRTGSSPKTGGAVLAGQSRAACAASARLSVRWTPTRPKTPTTTA